MLMIYFYLLYYFQLLVIKFVHIVIFRHLKLPLSGNIYLG